MVDPALVLFAIQAAVKLGRKTYEVLLDSTQAEPLLLPIGSLAGSIKEAEAIEFFDRPENRPLVDTEGPYHNFAGPRLISAFLTVNQIGERLGTDGGSTAEAVDIIRGLYKFEQHKQGFGPRSPWQRIAGTVVEIGIDYFVANPQAMGKDSSARRIVEAFLVGIQDIPFAEGDRADIVSDTLMAGLKVLGDNANLVSNDARVHVLLGGVTASLRADLEATGSLGQLQNREELFKRITASILRGGASAVAGNTDLFIRGDGPGKALVQSTLTGMLGATKDREDLFSNDALEDLFRAALKAAAENAPLFTDKKIVQAILASTVTALTGVEGGKLFTGAAVEAIACAALQTVGENAETLVDPAHPEWQPIAQAVSAMACGLATELAGGASVKSLLSTTQVIQLAEHVFFEVAKHPERLLGSRTDDPRRTALAQVLGSVASALGDQPTRLVNGTTFVELVQTSLAIAMKNLDKLLDLRSSDPKTNLLFKALDALVRGALSGPDGRRLVDRDVFVATAEGMLRTVSANTGLPPDGIAQVVNDAVVTVLQLSTGSLENRINGDNLPLLIEGLVGAGLRGDLRLADPNATGATAVRLLGTAA